MSARLRRQEIKRDEFKEGLVAAVDYVRSHTRLILGGLGAVALLVVAVALFLGWRAHREERAQEMLGRALEAYSAPVVAQGARPDDPAAPSFADAGARDTRARELLEGLRTEFGGTAAADIAAAYVGQLAAARGDLEAARGAWEEFLGRQGEHMLAAQVELNLMAVDRAQGRGEELATRLRAMLEQGRGRLPADAVLHQLAVTLEELGRAEEARDVRRRLADEHPGSPWAIPDAGGLGGLEMLGAQGV